MELQIFRKNSRFEDREYFKYISKQTSIGSRKPIIILYTS